MAQNLNPASAGHANYGATSSRVISMPDVTFSPTEFMSLSENIAQNIRSVNSTCLQLEKSLKPNKIMNYAVKENMLNVQSKHMKTKDQIDSANRDLQRLTAIVTRADKQQKLQLEKLTTDFGNVVAKYSELQKQVTAAMKLAIAKQVQNAARLQDEERTAADQETLIQIQQMEEQNRQFENSLLEDRERQIKEIETVMTSVGDIMKKMSEIVLAQGESIDRIEDRIEYSATEIDQARSELEKANAYRRSHRRKIFILVAIAVIIGLIVSGILYAKLS